MGKAELFLPKKIVKKIKNQNLMQMFAWKVLAQVLLLLAMLPKLSCK